MMKAIKINGTLVVVVNYKPELLPTTDGYIMVDEIPEAEQREGFYAELHYSEAKGFWYEYKEIEIPVIEDPVYEPTPDELYRQYEERVEFLIRQKYTISEEFSILRQKDEKKAEFEEYYNYCEQCKLNAR